MKQFIVTKRILLVSIFFMFVLLGCENAEYINENSNSLNPTETNVDYYDQFPDIVDIGSYLELDSNDIITINDDLDDLVICFTQDLSQDSISKYIDIQQKKGYKLKLYDGTISSTFCLENKKNKISITLISNIEEWKKLHGDEIDLHKMNTENVVYEIKTK